MTHAPRKRRIFALLDNRLKPEAKKKLLHHLEQCSVCSDYHRKMKKLRTVAVSACPIETPDWTRMDAAVQSAYQEVISIRNRRRFPAGPWYIPLGAAAAVIAILLFRFATQDPVRRDTSPRERSSYTSVDAQITDTLLREEPPENLHVIEGSDRIATSSCQSARLLFGKNAEAEIGPSSHVGVITLAEYTPKIELFAGALSLRVPKSSAVDHGGIEVLAGDAHFQVLYGVVEFGWQEDRLIVRVIEGQLDHLSESHPQSLEIGVWQYAPSASSERGQDPQISRIGRLSKPDHDLLNPSDSLQERAVWRSESGTLSKRVIRKVLSPVMPKLRGCYEQALKRDPHLTLTTSLRVTVNKHGRISKVRTQGIGNQPKLKGCFEEVTKAALFPPPTGGPVEFILPLRLYPRY